MLIHLFSNLRRGFQLTTPIPSPNWATNKEKKEKKKEKKGSLQAFCPVWPLFGRITPQC
jgi:hypothetical protein